MRDEIKREADINYLLSRIGDVPKLISSVEHAIPIAEAVDALGERLRRDIDSILNTRMWQHVREGQLQTSAVRNVSYRRPDGSTGSRPEEYFEPFGAKLTGIAMLDPRTTAVAPRLKGMLTILKAIKIDGPFADLIAGWRDDVRHKTAKQLSSNITKATEAFDAIDDMRSFFSPMNLATFRGWNSHAGCPTRIFMSYDGSSVHIGRVENNNRRFPVDPAFERVLRRPDILAVGASAKVA